MTVQERRHISPGRRSVDRELARMADGDAPERRRGQPGRRGDDHYREGVAGWQAWAHRANVLWVLAWLLLGITSVAGLARGEDIRNRSDRRTELALIEACRDVNSLRANIIENTVRQRAALEALARGAKRPMPIIDDLIASADSQLVDLRGQDHPCTTQRMRDILRHGG